MGSESSLNFGLCATRLENDKMVMCSKTPGASALGGGPIQSALSAAARINQTGPMPDLRKGKDERALDKDEEDYFNEDRCGPSQFFPIWKCALYSCPSRHVRTLGLRRRAHMEVSRNDHLNLNFTATNCREMR